jgi:hypothetical protein
MEEQASSAPTPFVRGICNKRNGMGRDPGRGRDKDGMGYGDGMSARRDAVILRILGIDLTIILFNQTSGLERLMRQDWC